MAWAPQAALKEALGGHRLIFSGFWVALGSLLGVALAPLGRLLGDFWYPKSMLECRLVSEGISASRNDRRTGAGRR